MSSWLLRDGCHKYLIIIISYKQYLEGIFHAKFVTCGEPLWLPWKCLMPTLLSSFIERFTVTDVPEGIFMYSQQE